MRKVKFGDLLPDERKEIASVAADFAKCQCSIDETNEDFKRLLERKRTIDLEIESARNRYAKLESTMKERLGEEFEIEVDGEMPIQILAMMGTAPTPSIT